ncbi:DNA-binding transcriptional MocR family regulator [Nocardiopsis arvandica]|uniref:DNA-binding transcriptional MocR family regulator n=1 Tax=Nocardiopsis sinuspersici TaxID=501010 RepID=A0A7Z0BH35_9ACTN|nr:PLP-dependent aminotransferase family protein [Nocardiopsis sinuspersici]NYH50701.1 DNA-binding transcriptional MocR family regulator [Nocardiopsis sinuspersici]
MKKNSSVADLRDRLRMAFDRYPPGEKLPSSRSLVEQYGVSPVTVSRAVARLAAEGFLVTRPGAGSFRARNERPARAPEDTSWQEVALSAEPATAPGEGLPRSVDDTGVLATLSVPLPGVTGLHGGYLHASLRPERALASALAGAARRPGVWAQPPVEGLEELRGWFAREIAGPSGPLDAADVLVTGGGQSSLTTALRALAPPGSSALVESPTYPGLLAAARACGVRPVPVPVDADGLRTDLLEDAFAATGARLLLCQPLFHNPTGAVLAPHRRAEVLRIARAANAFVVEDDFARRLAHTDAAPLPPTLASEDEHGTVVHACSLTKVTSPSLRVGALAARGPVLRRLRAIQVVDSFFVARPLQEAALELVGSPAWPRHLRAVAAGLAERRTAMTDALVRELPHLEQPVSRRGGYHLWLRLPEGSDESETAAAALREGVAVAPGRAYFPAEPTAPHLRLGFAGTSGAQEVTLGVRRLARALRAR